MKIHNLNDYILAPKIFKSGIKKPKPSSDHVKILMTFNVKRK